MRGAYSAFTEVIRKEEQELNRQYNHSANGAIMVERLQQEIQNGGLKDTAPDVQRRLIREQLKDTDYTTAYIDIAAVIENEGDTKGLEEITRALGMDAEETERALANRQIAVPVEVLSQTKANTNILEATSYAAGNASVARIRLDAKETYNSIQVKAEKAAVKFQEKLNAILETDFKGVDSKARNVAQELIEARPDNPYAGYQDMLTVIEEELNNEIAPILTALKNGIGKGVDIISPEDRDGRGIRVSNNDIWYSNWYKYHGRSPSKKELRELALDIAKGTANRDYTPYEWNMENFIDRMEEEEQENYRLEQDAKKKHLDYLEETLELLKEIKPQMQNLTGEAMTLTEELSPEGYGVYSALTKALNEGVGIGVFEDNADNALNQESNALNQDDIDRNIAAGTKAIEHILATHEDVKGAMERPEIGKIDFVYGQEGTEAKKYKDGYGIAKILKKHGNEAVQMIPSVIANGVITQEYKDRVYFNYGNYKAVVRLTWENENKIWLVTNFTKDKTPRPVGVVSRPTDTAVKPSLSLNGEGVSSITNITEESPESKETLNAMARIMGVKPEDMGKAKAKVKRTAKANAILFARHADRVAERFSEVSGRKYTAKDYFRNVVIRFGGEVNREGLNALREEISLTANTGFFDELNQSMYRSREVNFTDFARKAIEGDADTLKSYFTIGEGENAIDVPASAIRHIQNSEHKHPLTIEQYEELGAALLSNIKAAGISKRQKSIDRLDLVLRVGVSGTNLGVVLNVYPKGRVVLNTVMPKSEQTAEQWIKEKGSHALHGQSHGVASNPFTISSIKENEEVVKRLAEIKEKTGGTGKGGTVQGQFSIIGNGLHGKKIISLFETADESTFSHEMAHMFYKDLEGLAEIGHEESIKDLAVVNEWAEWREGQSLEYDGTDWADEFARREERIRAAIAGGDKIAEEQEKRIWKQERFARGFERYLLEGETPAKGLARVFADIRRAIRYLYQAFTSDGGKPGEDVRRVMDRMIATDKEIDERLAKERYRSLTEEHGKAAFGEDGKNYEEFRLEVLEEAKAILRKSINDTLKGKRKREYERAKASLAAEVEDSLTRDKVYLAERIYEETEDKEAVKVMGYGSFEEWEAEYRLRGSKEKYRKEKLREARLRLDDIYAKEVIDEEKLDDTLLNDENVAALAELEAGLLKNKVTGRRGAAVD